MSSRSQQGMGNRPPNTVEKMLLQVPLSNTAKVSTCWGSACHPLTVKVTKLCMSSGNHHRRVSDNCCRCKFQAQCPQLLTRHRAIQSTQCKWQSSIISRSCKRRNATVRTCMTILFSFDFAFFSVRLFQPESGSRRN